MFNSGAKRMNIRMRKADHTSRPRTAVSLIPPAKAGISCLKRMRLWPKLPAFSGMTKRVSHRVKANTEQDTSRCGIAMAGAACMLALLALTPAQAQEPQPAGTFGAWTAYHYKTKKGPVCYIVGRPQKSEAFRNGKKLAKVNRDPAFFLVTNRPADKVRHEVNTIIGYAFKPNTPARLTIDGSTFTLFTVRDGAWSEGPATDRRIVAAMKRGKTMTVTGISRRGTKTVDTYSLKGVTAALKKIDELCAGGKKK